MPGETFHELLVERQANLVDTTRILLLVMLDERKALLSGPESLLPDGEYWFGGKKCRVQRGRIVAYWLGRYQTWYYLPPPEDKFIDLPPFVLPPDS